MTDTGKRNLVVMTVRIARGPDAGYQDLDAQRLFSSYEQQLFTRVVAVAEKAGKHVDLLVVPSTDVYQAAVMTAAQIDSWDLFAGISEVMAPEEQARRMGEAWESLPAEVIASDPLSHRGRQRRGPRLSPGRPRPGPDG